ncbi:choice-of-anchor P family protein [Catellatospora sp. KI3]|uniref:choice-of-anchor P family protein n=1 Tax=Catellatospora sp. KI3 TaxID=3041620 RepID=UPI0024827FC3|nr:choice-of-anchor P family protein [Catellatospora sp. KI3]MDI1465397.1 choice-of-anchor P family protein [Catellatospora sp. KI3]
MKRKLIALVAASVLVAAPAFATDANLPGGTAITVAIATPADGAAVPPGPVSVTGTASVGTGVPVANTSLIYVLDASSSTGNPGAPSCGNILRCEIAAGLALNAQAQSGAIGDVGMVAFGVTAATADVRPAAGDQLLTGPSTDGDGDGVRDIEQVLSSTYINGVATFTDKNVGGGQTNFADAIAKTRTVAEASSRARKIVVFMSDGFAVGGGSINVPLAGIPENIDIYTFAVGNGADCTNPGPNNEGSLEQITAATVPGGHCVQVTDVGSLPAILPDVIASSLDTLAMRVDGGPFTPIGDAAITPDLPQSGPAGVSYTVDTPTLGLGSHQICVRATGTDGGGAGQVTDCRTVVVYGPAGAFALEATGLVTVPRTPEAVCPPGAVRTQAAVNLAPLLTTGVLNASCVAADGTTTARASVDGARLLGGAIQLSAVSSTCTSGSSGTTRASQVVGSINGAPINAGPATIGIPGVAVVHLNESATGPGGRLVQNAVRVEVLGLFGIVTQQIVLGSCYLG